MCLLAKSKQITMALELKFRVHIGVPELVRPETPTPRELKYLSNIDDQIGIRHHIPFVHLYPPCPSKDLGAPQDPVVIIKHALAKVLVYYYPVAGRLRNADRGKLVVDCCGEGVIFREADADVTLAELQKMDVGGLKPPIPQWDRLLVDDVWGSNLITDSPLLRMQVTRLACGGFILAYTFNHCICDAYGAYQFITAVSKFSTNPNQSTPPILPTWGREVLKPRSPPIVSYPHLEYNTDTHPISNYTETEFKSLAQTSIFFSKSDILALKAKIKGNNFPTFDAIASCLWRARTRTLFNNLEIGTRLTFPIDTRFRSKSSLPKGYYGNAVVYPCATTKASELIRKPLQYAASLVAKVKNEVMGDEYRASVLDFIEVNQRRGFRSQGTLVVSDISRLKFADVDFGWGHGIYGGMARAGVGPVPGMAAVVIGHKDEEGVEGLLALVSLPLESVDMFRKEVRVEINCINSVNGLSTL